MLQHRAGAKGLKKIGNLSALLFYHKHAQKGRRNFAMKRPNGSGTVVKMPGPRRRPYAVRLSVRDSKGKIAQKYLSYHATQKEAFAALEAYQQKRGQGLAPAPEALGVTVETVFELWSARKFEKVGASAIACYRASWKRVSRFATKPIRSIGIDQWQSLIDSDERDGLSKSSINNDVTLIHALCSFAMERDWITKDYSQFIQLSTVAAKYEKGAFTSEEVHTLQELATIGIAGADAAFVLCYTGFRITEFLPLTPASYNPKERTLRGGIKTAAGKNRIVPVHPKIEPYITRWANADSDFLYKWHGSSRTSGSFRQTLFAPLMERLRRSAATPHWCRHTFASLLHSAGAKELNIKHLMGHSDKDVTEHYTHVTLEELRETILQLP